MVCFLCKIGFVLKGYHGKSQYYSANIKPFVDLSHGLQSIGEEAILFIDESEKHLYEKIRTITRDKVPIIYTQPSDIEKLLIENSVKYVVVEDDIEMMKTALKFQINGIKKAVFVQYLYGVNTNKREKRSTSLALTIGSYLPWMLVTKMYRDLLVRFDYIIPNSQTCGYILRQFYDVSPSGTVYPPVGVDMRPIIDNMSINVEKKGILVFAGNLEHDYFSRNIVAEITTLKEVLEEPVKMFVSNPDSSLYFSNKGIDVYSQLSVRDLVILYSRSKITYVPTSYELFGYVGAESILCSTPVILDAYHPFLERFPMETNTVKIASPKTKISDAVCTLLNDHIDVEKSRKAILYNYSSEESAKELLRSLDLST